MRWIRSLFLWCLQTPWDSECDVWWDETMRDSPEECEPEWLDAEDPLFILYTSGSTGKPKVRLCKGSRLETRFTAEKTQFF